MLHASYLVAYNRVLPFSRTSTLTDACQACIFLRTPPPSSTQPGTASCEVSWRDFFHEDPANHRTSAA